MDVFWGVKKSILGESSFIGCFLVLDRKALFVKTLIQMSPKYYGRLLANIVEESPECTLF